MSVNIIDIEAELIRLVTGRLLTEEQIRKVTNSTVGKYFSEYFPEPSGEQSARERVNEASGHINKANAILSQMQYELTEQSKHLDNVIQEIDKNKSIANRYKEIASLNEAQTAAIRSEMSETLKKELTAQSNEGRKIRIFIGVIKWTSTLIIGAWLGAYYKDIERALSSMLH